MILKMKYSLYSILLILPAFAHGANELAEKNWEQKMDLFFGEYIVGPLAALLFWPIPGIEMPLVVKPWLLGVHSSLPSGCASSMCVSSNMPSN